MENSKEKPHLRVVRDPVRINPLTLLSALTPQEKLELMSTGLSLNHQCAIAILLHDSTHIPVAVTPGTPLEEIEKERTELIKLGWTSTRYNAEELILYIAR